MGFSFEHTALDKGCHYKVWDQNKRILWERTVIAPIASNKYGEAYQEMLLQAQVVPLRQPTYSATTIANDQICFNVSYDECLKLVKTYQAANNNPMCKIFVHEVVKRHFDLVRPEYGQIPPADRNEQTENMAPALECPPQTDNVAGSMSANPDANGNTVPTN